MMAYGGTSQSQNAYTIDGVNVADTANGQYWLLPSIQWMQEIQIAGLGATAEYGGFTGGIINGVTKSGGNEFHGGVEYYYQPKSWTDSNDPSGDATPFSFTDASISLGGPVVKDKLWYFVSGEYWEQEQTPIGATASDKRTTPRYLGKLTWQANEGNRLMFMAERDDLKHENRGIDIYTLPEATSDEESPNNTFALNWESLINASNFINLKLTGYVGELNYLPYNGNDTPGPRGLLELPGSPGRTRRPAPCATRSRSPSTPPGASSRTACSARTTTTRSSSARPTRTGPRPTCSTATAA